MTYNSAIHHRRSIRLRGYDYSKAGAYFVTICTQNRECLFGHIIDGQMRLNDAGGMIQTVWDEMPLNYPGIETDEFVVMPNHIHGIVVIGVGACPCACPDSGRPQPQKTQPQKTKTGRPQPGPQAGQPQGVAPTGINPTGATATSKLSLPDVVHRFKTMTTKRYTDGVKQHQWRRFPAKLWQRNYWEHIVRNEPDLNRIRKYICNNPTQWALDKLRRQGAP